MRSGSPATGEGAAPDRPYSGAAGARYGPRWSSGGTTRPGSRGREAAVARLPPRVRGVAERLMRRWAGRFVVRTAASVVRVELFDRSMAIAAQVFTSVFPLLILLGSWLPLDQDAVAAALGLPA